MSPLSCLVLYFTALLALVSIAHAAPLEDQWHGSNSSGLINLGKSPSERVSDNHRVQRPIYAIAHRVLTADGVRDAVSHGANAIEVDMMAYKKHDSYEDGWWAAHDTLSAKGAQTARMILEAVGSDPRARDQLSFVWLDIKNSEKCETHRACSIQALRDLARELLQPHGIRVLYGFYDGAGSRPALHLIRRSLNDDEAISLNGYAFRVRSQFDSLEPSLPVAKRVMDHGFFNLRLPRVLRKCASSNAFHRNVCSELSKAADIRDYDHEI